jgi:hypothetical protein
MITFSGTGASGSAQPSNTASLSAAMRVSDTSAKAPQSGPAKRETSSRAINVSPYRTSSSFKSSDGLLLYLLLYIAVSKLEYADTDVASSRRTGRLLHSSLDVSDT